MPSDAEILPSKQEVKYLEYVLAVLVYSKTASLYERLSKEVQKKSDAMFIRFATTP